MNPRKLIVSIKTDELVCEPREEIDQFFQNLSGRDCTLMDIKLEDVDTAKTEKN